MFKPSELIYRTKKVTAWDVKNRLKLEIKFYFSQNTKENILQISQLVLAYKKA